jgi:hypothetical protein
MSIAEIEIALSFRLPDAHRAALVDAADPIHDACDFLVLDSPHELLRFLDANNDLRRPERPDPWPDFLVAFASNGCGDYFAYDIRSDPYAIVYIDPDRTVAENLACDDDFTFESFDEWHARALS